MNRAEIIFLIFSFIWFLPVGSIEESFCFGVGYNNLDDKGKGLKSMGASQWYSHPMNTFWAAHHLPINFSSPDTPTVRVERVRGLAADGKLVELNGWLHISIERKSHAMAAIAVWAITGTGETFGEFVTVTESECTPGQDWERKEIVPCSATPINAPLNPNMFIRASLSDQVQKVDLLWKADMSYCLFPNEFAFFIVVSPSAWDLQTSSFKVEDAVAKKLGPLVYRTSFIAPKFFGAASPNFDKNKLLCTSDKDGLLKTDVGWLQQKIAAGVNNGYLFAMEKLFYEDRWAGGNEKDFVVNRRTVCKAEKQGFVDFGGRCLSKNSDATNKGQRVWASLNSPPQCVKPTKLATINSAMFERLANTTFVHFKDYVLGTRKEQVLQSEADCVCPPIPTAQDVKAKAAKVDKVLVRRARRDIRWTAMDANPYLLPDRGCRAYVGRKEYHLHGLCLVSNAGQFVFGVRVWHALANLLCCMVIIPISCFMARYLKGSIPIANTTENAYIRVKSWYINHILLVLPIICMYATGMSSIRRQRSTLGKSLTGFATFHRISGLVIMVLFAFQCIFGFLRPINIRARTVSIFMHWFCGYVVYYFGAIVCILTYRIPASPFTFRKLLDPSFNRLYYHTAPTLVLVWMIIDVIFHISVTRYVIKYEKARLGVKKIIFFPVFLPMRVDNYILAHQDLRLHRTFVGYCTFCIVFFILVLLSVSYLNFELNHGYGPMSCTHDSNYKFTAGVDKNGSATIGHLKSEKSVCQHDGHY